MRPRTFRSLLGALAGAFILIGGIVPKADAQILVTYFNFEDTTTGATIGSGPGEETPLSQPPGIETGIPLDVSVNLLPQPTSTQGVNANVAPGDLVPNLHGMGFVTTTGGTATMSFTLPNTIGLTNLSLSFAVNNNGNGFSTATPEYSLNGGAFVALPDQTIHTGAKVVVAIDFPAAVDNQTTPVTFRVVLSGGTSMGSNVQTIVDNIQLNATPEPPTTATGALAILGLCWYRRRWLIRLLRRV
jgi:hypothetical protein